jgi:hypothetical protein
LRKIAQPKTHPPPYTTSRDKKTNIEKTYQTYLIKENNSGGIKKKEASKKQ